MNWNVIICCLAAIMCALLLALSGRYVPHGSIYVLDRWTGKLHPLSEMR